MASVTSFIRNTPASSLQAYFDAAGIELPTPVNWEAPEQEIVKPLLQAVDEMDEEARARVLNDADRVGSLADDAGQTALYSVIDDRSRLDDLVNGHARALWMFLNEPVLFRHAEEVRYTDERRRGRRPLSLCPNPGDNTNDRRSQNHHRVHRPGRPRQDIAFLQCEP